MGCGARAELAWPGRASRCWRLLRRCAEQRELLRAGSTPRQWRAPRRGDFEAIARGYDFPAQGRGVSGAVRHTRGSRRAGLLSEADGERLLACSGQVGLAAAEHGKQHSDEKRSVSWQVPSPMGRVALRVPD
jgi:hypothetical protein